MSRSNGAMAMATVLASLLGHSINTTEALRVTAPSEGMTVVAERPYIVSWTGANADDRFEIDLHYGGSYSFGFEDDADCGFWLANVCSAGDDACMQQEDMSSQVTLPQPIKGYSNNGYRIRISEVGAEKARCSDDFYLMATADVPAVGEAGGPTMAVISPDEGSLAEAGGTYTVEFDYDNGFGERVGRFRIDLYKAQEGTGDCGLWVTSICDKPERGCHDSQGDYDVTIPRNTAEGMYSIRVGLFGDDSIFACSAPFEIAPAGEGGEELWGGSYSY